MRWIRSGGTGRCLLRYCLLLLLVVLLARMHFRVDTIHLDSCVTRCRHLYCVRARPPAQQCSQCRLSHTVEQAATYTARYHSHLH